MKKDKMKASESERGNEEAFLAFLKKAGQSEAFRKITAAVEEQGHPSSDMLYEFFEGRLDTAESDIVKDHVALCSICHKELSHIRAVEAELAPLAFQDDEKTARDRLRPLLSNIAARAADWRQWIYGNPWRAVQAAGVIAVSVFFILWMGLPGASERLDKMIDQSYHVEYFQQIRLSKYRYDLPWETPVTSYGFAGGAEPTDASRAFGAGLWSGRRMLRKNETTTVSPPDFLTPLRQEGASKAETWSDTPWNPYYQMGKWCFLIYVVSHGDQRAPVSFWGDQMAIVEQLREVYAEATRKGAESAGVVTASLNALASEFAGLKEKNQKSTKKVAFEIRNLIVYLSSGLSPGDKK